MIKVEYIQVLEEDYFKLKNKFRGNNTDIHFKHIDNKYYININEYSKDS